MRFVRPISLLIGAGLLTGAQYPVPPKAQRGKANAQCRASEPGPAARLAVEGLLDRKGMLRLELYPANDADFLASDKELIRAGKPFKRVEVKTPASGAVSLCIRAPAPGRYALAVLHDRDGDGKFGVLRDGAGFPGNPRLGRAKPKASAVSLTLNGGVVSTSVRMNYRRGLGFGPVGGK